MSELPGASEAASPASGVVARVENIILSLTLAAMVVLPLAESFLRSTIERGITAAPILVQHLTLFVGMVGGAVAARENRLLSLSTASLLPEGWRAPSCLFANSFAAAISALFCVASLRFVLTEKLGGGILAYGIPVWIVQLILPLGFAMIAFRLFLHAAPRLRGRIFAAAIITSLILLGAYPPVSPESFVLPGLIALVAATVLGTPIFVTLGGAAMILFWGAGVPIAALPVEHYRLVTNPTLPSIPLFTLAGYFLAEGGASRRLIRVFDTLAGWFHGGPVVVTVLVCAFFTTFTGASGVTILALGGLLMPILLAARFSEKHSLGLLTGAGSLGLLFPPCLPLILYAIIAGVTIEEMFLGGILPGILLMVLVSVWGITRKPVNAATGQPFDLRAASQALWEAKWELLLPAVALGALFGGFATPIEAAALTAFYAFVVETVIYRDLKIFADSQRVLTKCGLLVGGVLLILGVALGFTNYLVDAEIPDRILAHVTATVESRFVFLLLLNAILLVIGCLMDVFSAIIVVVPIIIPIGEAFGIDPVHLGIIFLANLELGYLTPPVGMNLFLSAYRFNKPMLEVYRSVVPILFVLLAGVLLITYVPWMTTALPNWLAR